MQSVFSYLALLSEYLFVGYVCVHASISVPLPRGHLGPKKTSIVWYSCSYILDPLNVFAFHDMKKLILSSLVWFLR